MYACIGLLTTKKTRRERERERETDGGFQRGRRGKGTRERNYSQSFAVIGWLGRDVERDPAVWTVERDGAHFLQVARARACAYGERGGRVGIQGILEWVWAVFWFFFCFFFWGGGMREINIRGVQDGGGGGIMG